MIQKGKKKKQIQTKKNKIKNGSLCCCVVTNVNTALEEWRYYPHTLGVAMAINNKSINPIGHADARANASCPHRPAHTTQILQPSTLILELENNSCL